jgi:hypothetical protein
MKFYEIIAKFKPYRFFDFSLKIHLESKEVSIEKVVSLFKPFKIIFYSKFFEVKKVLFRSNKV